MAAHASFEANLKADLKRVPSEQAARSSGVETSRSYGMRRVITREQGVAIEMLGHAVDYLDDCYLHEGADDEILDFTAPAMLAAQILVSAQRQILHSLPLTEPLTHLFWNAVLRRKSQFKSAAVVPLSSSR